MPTLLQIDTCLGMGSTGRITESIGELANKSGWDCHIIHGARYAKKTSCMSSIQSVTKHQEYFNIFRNLLLDDQGLSASKSTRRVIKKIEVIKPNVIHLHCIHGYYLNYIVLFDYLKQSGIPVVWTFHDCWSFTGHCGSFESCNCTKWKYECSNCELKHDYPKSILLDKSTRNFRLKKKTFLSIKDLTIVSVSYWLYGLVKQSFFKDYATKVIYNGIDTDIFKYRESGIRQKLNLNGVKVLLAAATAWSEAKGLKDYVRLSELLPEDFKLILVGLKKKQIDNLPDRIIGIERTESAIELAQYYSMADIVLNLSYQETFGLTTVEGMSCGTPGIVYDRTASPELISDQTGIVVPAGNMEKLQASIFTICSNGKEQYSKACRQRVLSCFNKDDRFLDYIHLYEQLIANK